ncbi:MAG: diaminopimelate epimerase [Clostridiales bacterium]|nr:diaminopimelate epimerase [Clostridiales bacterium]
MRFVKMHGIGNDYVFMDSFTGSMPNDPSRLAIRMSRAHFGIGSDGLIFITPSDVADARMRIFNADGSEAQTCGNGLRCVGKYLYEAGLCEADFMTVETAAGVRALELDVQRGKVRSVTVDMGEPRLRPGEIPVIADGERAVDLPLEALGQSLRFTCVSMGNPHAVTFDRMPDDAQFYALGPAYERHPAFPQRANIEFARVDGDRIHVRVWERGSGETMACGSGACAVLVAAAITGRSGRRMDVALPGGTLRVDWRANNRVYLTGPAVTVFTGEWLDDGTED